jgi:hypothetical protein
MRKSNADLSDHSQSGAPASGLAWAVAIILAGAAGAKAQDDSAFHEIETKYIFGDITVGASTGIEGERAFEPETGANFGKRGGNYAGSLTELEYE